MTDPPLLFLKNGIVSMGSSDRWKNSHPGDDNHESTQLKPDTDLNLAFPSWRTAPDGSIDVPRLVRHEKRPKRLGHCRMSDPGHVQ